MATRKGVMDMDYDNLLDKIVDFISQIRPLTKSLETVREPWMGKVWKMTGLLEYWVPSQKARLKI